MLEGRRHVACTRGGEHEALREKSLLAFREDN